MQVRAFVKPTYVYLLLKNGLSVCSTAQLGRFAEPSVVIGRMRLLVGGIAVRRIVGVLDSAEELTLHIRRRRCGRLDRGSDRGVVRPGDSAGAEPAPRGVVSLRYLASGRTRVPVFVVLRTCRGRFWAEWNDRWPRAGDRMPSNSGLVDVLKPPSFQGWEWMQRVSGSIKRAGTTALQGR